MANERLVFSQTLFNGAVTQFAAFPFNSFARVGDNVLGFNEDGVYVLGGSSNAGANIGAYFEIYADFGQTVRLRSLWIGYETSGTLTVTTTVDDRTADAQSFTLSPVLTANRQHGAKLYLSPHRDKGQFLRVRVENSSGADFSLDEITALIIPLGHRREGR